MGDELDVGEAARKAREDGSESILSVGAVEGEGRVGLGANLIAGYNKTFCERLKGFLGFLVELEGTLAWGDTLQGRETDHDGKS